MSRGPEIQPPVAVSQYWSGHTRHPLASLFYTLTTTLVPAVSLPLAHDEVTRCVMEKCLVTVPAAFMHVRDNLEELGKVADDTDLLFLKGLLDSPVVTSLVKVSFHIGLYYVIFLPFFSQSLR